MCALHNKVLDYVSNVSAQGSLYHGVCWHVGEEVCYVTGMSVFLESIDRSRVRQSSQN